MPAITGMVAASSAAVLPAAEAPVAIEMVAPAITGMVGTVHDAGAPVATEMVAAMPTVADASDSQLVAVAPTVADASDSQIVAVAPPVADAGSMFQMVAAGVGSTDALVGGTQGSADANEIADDDLKKNQYQLSEAMLAAVHSATSSKDLTKQQRNTLYQAIGRCMKAADEEKIFVPPAVIARYHEAQEVRGQRLCIYSLAVLFVHIFFICFMFVGVCGCCFSFLLCIRFYYFYCWFSFANAWFLFVSIVLLFVFRMCFLNFPILYLTY